MAASLAKFLLAIGFMSTLGSSVLGQLIVGHRGASYDAPENSLAAFKLAIEQGADGFEGDYWLNSEGHILCLHDKDTARTSGKKLSVTKAPFEDLRALDIGSWKNPKWHAERMPTFEESLAVVPAGKKFFIELKSGPEIVAPLVKAITQSPIARNQLVIISFNDEVIAKCKKQMPEIKALWLCSFRKKKNETPPLTAKQVAATLKRIQADGLNAEAVPSHVNAEFIQQLRELGYPEFGVWTVDDPKVAKFYAQLGASAITTNRPSWLREQLNK